MSIKGENLLVRIQRVDNGWVVDSLPLYRERDGGYCTEGTHVATTPNDLSDLLFAWATEQANKEIV